MRRLAYLILLILSPCAYADLFTPADQDLSIALLGMIFGSNIGSINLGGTYDATLSQLIEQFNFIIIIIGSVVISYVTVMSTINTAHEGQAMGKKWSALWIPLRSLSGIALMVPSTTSGYSMIQVFVIYVVMHGIGAADQIWNSVLQGLASGVSAMAGSKPSNASVLYMNAPAVAQSLLNAEICMQTFNQAAIDPINKSSWFFGQTFQPFAVQTTQATCTTTGCSASGAVNFGVQNDPNGQHQTACGSISLNPTTTTADYPASTGGSPNTTDMQNIFNGEVKTIITVLNVWRPLVQGWIQADDPIPASIAPATNIAPGSTSTLAQAGYNYNAQGAFVNTMSLIVVPNATLQQAAIANTSLANTNGAIGPVETSTFLDTSAEIQTAITNGQNSGWITAGAYYFILNRTLNSMLFSTVAAANFSSNNAGTPSCLLSDTTCYNTFYNTNNTYLSNPGANGFKNNPNDQTTYNNLSSLQLSDTYIGLMSKYLAWGSAYITLDLTGNNNTGGFQAYNQNPLSSTPISSMWSNINNMSSTNLQNLTNTMQSVAQGADPLYAHVVLGYEIMVVCETLWMTMMVVGLVTAFATVEAMGVMIWAAAVIFALCGLAATFWAIGASMAIYSPLIPFMIFTFAALGWILTVVEAVIAAPIIALAIVMPTGDDIGRAGAALSILAAVFLRPMLMVFGFLLAGRVYYAVVQLIDSTIFNIFKTINVNTMFSSIVIFFAYTSFILSVTNTSFSLIYAVPDRVLRWIGVTGEHTDVSAMQEVKQAAQQAAGGIGKQAGGAADQAIESGSKTRTEKMEKGKDEGKTYKGAGTALKDKVGAAAKAIRNSFTGGG